MTPRHFIVEQLFFLLLCKEGFSLNLYYRMSRTDYHDVFEAECRPTKPAWVVSSSFTVSLLKRITRHYRDAPPVKICRPVFLHTPVIIIPKSRWRNSLLFQSKQYCLCRRNCHEDTSRAWRISRRYNDKICCLPL